jgi:hypothetical protein
MWLFLRTATVLVSTCLVYSPTTSPLNKMEKRSIFVTGHLNMKVAIGVLHDALVVLCHENRFFFILLMGEVVPASRKV